MREVIYTDNDPNLMLALTLAAKKPVPLRIRATAVYMTKDGKIAPIPSSDYTNREGELKAGETTFYIRMPRTPGILAVQIYNPRVGDLPEGQDQSFQLVKKEVLPLDIHPEAYNSTSTLIQRGITFLQDFAERAPLLSAGPEGSTYRSVCGAFRIDYLDTIIERNQESQFYGQELTTPARIAIEKAHDGTYIMEVSKKYYLKYPVPYRVGIGAHEISHQYINTVSSDEFEADHNAFIICWGKGYGYIDLLNAFNTVFENAPSDQNVARYQALEMLADKLEKKYNRYK